MLFRKIKAIYCEKNTRHKIKDFQMLEHWYIYKTAVIHKLIQIFPLI